MSDRVKTAAVVLFAVLMGEQILEVAFPKTSRRLWQRADDWTDRIDKKIVKRMEQNSGR